MEKWQEDAKKLLQCGWTDEEVSRVLNVALEKIREININIEESLPHIISYTINELTQIVEKPPYEYVNIFNGMPVHKIMDTNLLPGEIFRKFPENKNVEVSNLGRIKIGNNIIEQWEDDPNGKDYLYVKLGHFVNEEKYVYRFVAKTWCKKPWSSDVFQKWHVHHISNNGYDNRPSNLMWLKENDHSKVNHRK